MSSNTNQGYNFINLFNLSPFETSTLKLKLNLKEDDELNLSQGTCHFIIRTESYRKINNLDFLFAFVRPPKYIIEIQ